MLVDNCIVFPVTIVFEDGSTEQYNNITEIECNLEDFDSTLEPKCKVTDAIGKRLNLKVELLSLKELSVMAKL